VKEFFASLFNAGFTMFIINSISVFFLSKNLFNEISLILLFIAIYSINLVLLKHKSVNTLYNILRRTGSFNQAST
jgi:hypothetical protein